MAAPLLQNALLALVLLCSGVIAQDPFLHYNTSIPLGKEGFVRWDINAFAGPVNLWLQELAPNATAPQVPLDYSNTKGFFLWTAGSNLHPGQYFYQLQLVGGQGIIFKSNPLMILCSECPSTSSALAAPTSTGASPAGATAPSPAEPLRDPASGGQKLSAGAAAGIGVGGALGLVGIIALAFFLFRRSRKQKRSLNQPPSNGALSAHHQSLTPSSPPPKFDSSYEHAQEIKSGYGDPPPMTLVPNTGRQRGQSHELDTAAARNNPHVGAYQAQSGNMTPNRIPSPASARIVAPQPRAAPPPALANSGFQYQARSYSQTSPPTSDQRTPGSNHESGSYGFPSQDPSPHPDMEAFQFQQQSYPGTAGSPDSSQHVFPRRLVGTPNLRGGQQ